MDWYLYQNYIEIRIYGFELPPYKLPRHVPMRVFSLEYIRKMINMNDLHFVSGKMKAQFKIKERIGAFICNTRSTIVEAGQMLNKIGFQPSFTWSYYPHGIISSLRVELKTTSYTHTSREEIEKYMNQDQWVEGTLQDANEQVLSTYNVQTLVPERK